MVTAAPTAHSGALGLATLLTWIFTASLGAYMLRSLARHGALRRQRSVRDGLSPRVLYGHFSLALSGLVVWAARRVGRPKGPRAVGQANGRNPIAIIVPCHRVLAGNGIGGYGGGLPMKRTLLAVEGVTA